MNQKNAGLSSLLFCDKTRCYQELILISTDLNEDRVWRPLIRGCIRTWHFGCDLLLFTSRLLHALLAEYSHCQHRADHVIYVLVFVISVVCIVRQSLVLCSTKPSSKTSTDTQCLGIAAQQVPQIHENCGFLLLLCPL